MENGSNPSRFIPTIKLEHADSRGEIYSIELPDGHEIMLLHSTPGSLRGGHSHSCAEHVLMLSGRITYHIADGLLNYPTETMWDYSTGDLIYHEAGVIHLGEFLEDTWLMEYKLAKKGEWSQKDYEPYRSKVRKQNSA